MSLLKTALACLLLAVLAPLAGGQTLRPAGPMAPGQYSRSGGYYSPNSAMPVAAPPAPRTISYESSQPESWGESWTSDASESPESDESESEAPEAAPAPTSGWTPPQTPDDLWDSAEIPPNGYNAAAGPSCPTCSDGYCTDGSQSAVSSWLGSYRFGGGNMGFPGPWYISADAFLLHRSNGNANTPITLNSVTGGTMLSARDLTFTSKVGPRLMIGYAWSHTTAFELSYFGLIDSRTQAGVLGNGNLTLPGTLGLFAPDFFDANQVNVTYSSRINNAEFNVLRNTGCSAISWLYGFRYFGLNEHLDINSIGGTGVANYAIGTRNNMYGLQGGARLMVNYKRLALETTFKAGVLENATQQTQNVYDTGLPVAIRDTLSKGANVSFLGEIGLNAIYRFGERWALRGGYTLIWVDGLALAPNQLDYTVGPTSGTLLNHGGNLLLQAVSLGAEYHW